MGRIQEVHTKKFKRYSDHKKWMKQNKYRLESAIEVRHGHGRSTISYSWNLKRTSGYRK